jgi:hypothetical protein
VNDWQQFLDDVPWFLQPEETAVAGAEAKWTRGEVDGLPNLSALLYAATVTPVSVGDTIYELLAWGTLENRRGWLSLQPHGNDHGRVHETHQRFWSVCGGIVEPFGKPESWWNNQNEVLTASAARTPLSNVLAEYAWIWEDEGLRLPIDPEEYYVVAVEANGNLTLAHRVSGQLLLFAPDHAFDGVTPLPGCPPYSLLTINEIPDLATWIESCAAAWRYV